MVMVVRWSFWVPDLCLDSWYVSLSYQGRSDKKPLEIYETRELLSCWNGPSCVEMAAPARTPCLGDVPLG